MHVQVSEARYLWKLSKHFEFICDQSQRWNDDITHAHVESVYFRMLIETSKSYFLERNKVVKVSSESCYSCHAELIYCWRS